MVRTVGNTTQSNLSTEQQQQRTISPSGFPNEV